MLGHLIPAEDRDSYSGHRARKTTTGNAGNAANLILCRRETLVPPPLVTNVSVTNVLLGAEMRTQDGGRLVVGLESLAEEPRQRKEAVDGAGIVHIGRLHPGIDQPLGIGAPLVAQRVVTRGQHEGG